MRIKCQICHIIQLNLLFSYVDDDSGMGAFTAKLLKIPKADRSMSNEDDMSLQMPPMPPGSDGNMDGGMMMTGAPQGFFQPGHMGAMNPMMGMMGPSPDMMAMGNMENMMMFGGVCFLFLLCLSQEIGSNIDKLLFMQPICLTVV